MNAAEKINFSDVQYLIFDMMTENTGRHMLDSGGAYGRHWERNQGKTIEDFNSEPAATLDIAIRNYNGAPVVDLEVTASVFHRLSGVLELDRLCKEFNALPCDDWNSDIYGVSSEGFAWLEQKGFDLDQDAWNSYNWASNLSQTLQGQSVTLGDEEYILIQVHGGCDVRGGYTDAKLFKLGDWYESWAVVSEDCMFSDPEGDLYLDWRGEWITPEGTGADDEYFLAFAEACGAEVDGETITISGDLSEC